MNFQYWLRTSFLRDKSFCVMVIIAKMPGIINDVQPQVRILASFSVDMAERFQSKVLLAQLQALPSVDTAVSKLAQVLKVLNYDSALTALQCIQNEQTKQNLQHKTPTQHHISNAPRSCSTNVQTSVKVLYNGVGATRITPGSLLSHTIPASCSLWDTFCSRPGLSNRLS